jgi:hypothetical protein
LVHLGQKLVSDHVFFWRERNYVLWLITTAHAARCDVMALDVTRD